ncbi:MAG TPA: DNA cytosine methyltransferase [Fimbriimonadaceae bacterium]|nr:DNA cytosine methyltransferase [Fimbriimonadaceae bacterium]
MYGRIRPDGPFPTITTGFLTPGRGRFIHPCELRTLTPSEAAFVQGFPAWYDFGEDGELSRKLLTKWIGDAVPLPLGYVAAMAVLPGMLGTTLREVAGV